MIRILLLLCCVLIGMDFIEDYGGLEAYAENLEWLPLVQRIVVALTALIIVVSEYLKVKTFNITILVFLLVALIFNPFKHLEVSTVSKVAVIILFFIQAIKDKSGMRFNR
ncbi:MAG TPA: hypothetical protein VKX30_03075 [Flavobacteriaceae bacterium]|nr:hypothetical protein [Flavobacteriaceae bacterium]